MVFLIFGFALQMAWSLEKGNKLILQEVELTACLFTDYISAESTIDSPGGQSQSYTAGRLYVISELTS